LFWLAEARQQNEWQHTSTLIAWIANCHLDIKKRGRPFMPADFDPFARKAAAAAGKGKNRIRDLKPLMFPNKKGPTPCKKRSSSH
jgi:hypothetical protein